MDTENLISSAIDFFFPMNPIFLRSTTETNSKPNLEKLHKLVKKESSNKSQINDTISKENMPTNWIYSENLSNQVWNDLESGPLIESYVNKQFEDSPFQQIDQTTQRIKQTISNYEIEDQELLLDLIETFGDDLTIESSDSENLLIEARSKLFQMISEHLENADRQKLMLDSLRFWFTELQKGKSNEDPDFKIDKCDVQSFLDILANTAKTKEEKVENAINIHSDIVSLLMKRVSDIQKQLNQKEFLLAQASESGPITSTTTNKRYRKKLTGNIDTDKELTLAQRRIVEMQSQITSLKQALVEYARMAKEGTSSESFEPLISLEKELELDQKIAILTDEINELKGINNHLQNKLGKNKQNEMVLESKLSYSDKAKKQMETTIQNLNQKINQMETVYEEKLKVIKNEALLAPENDQTLIEHMNKYQTQIQEINERNQQEMMTLISENERKFRQQMKEIASAFDSKNNSTALNMTIEKYNNEMKQQQTQYEALLHKQKELYKSQLLDIAENYEKIILRKDKEKETIQNSIESSLRTQEIILKLDLEEDFSQKIFEINQKNFQDLSNTRIDLTQKIEELKKRLERTSYERNIMRTLIESSTIASLLDQLNFEDDEDEEEEETNEDVLIKSKCLLREKEVEQNVSTKYNQLLSMQREVFKQSNDWELNQTRMYYQNLTDRDLSEFRENTIHKIQNIENVENLLSAIIEELSQFARSSAKANVPMIPLIEVDRKLDQLKNRIVQLESENEVWKLTFNSVGQNLPSATKEELITAIRDAIKEQAEEFANLNQEKEVLARQVNEMKKQQKESEQENEILTFQVNQSKQQNQQKSRKGYNRYVRVTSYTIRGSPNNLEKSSQNFAQNKQNHTKTDSKQSNFSPNDSHPKSLTKQTSHESNFNQIDFYQDDLSTKQTMGSSKKTIRCTTTKPSTIIHYASVISPNANSNSSKNKNMICCSECSHYYVYSQNDIRTQTMNVSYVLCPDCLSQHIIKSDQIIEEKPKTKKKSPRSNSSENSLQNQFDLYKQQSLKIEQSYQNRVEQLEDGVGQMRKIFYEYSLRLLAMLNFLNDSTKMKNELKKMKNDTCYEISRRIDELNIAPPGDMKMCNIDILERLKQSEINQIDSDQILEQLKSLLIALSDSKLKFIAPKLEAQISNLDISNNKDILKFAKILNKEIKDLKVHQTHLADYSKKLIQEHKLFVQKVKGMLVKYAKQNSTVHFSNNENIYELQKQLLDEKRNVDRYKEMILQYQEKIDELSYQLEETASKYHKIEIQSELNSNNEISIKEFEGEEKATLEGLTEMILELRNRIHSKDKEIANLRLKIQSYETSIQIYNSKKNCPLSKSEQFIIFTYPLNSSTIEINTIQPNLRPKTSCEKVRIRQSGDRPQSAAGGGRVFTPSKNKMLIPKTDKNNKKNDVNGDSSIVVYVTPFAQNSKQRNIYIQSEEQVVSDNYLETSSFYSTTSITPDAETSKILMADHLPVKENQLNMSFFMELEKRIQFLQKQVTEMQQQIEQEKDRTHEANQALFRAAIQNQKAVREIKKQMKFKDNAMKGMERAILMVTERDKKVMKLSQQLIKLNKIATAISNKYEAQVEEAEKNDKKQSKVRGNDDTEEAEQIYLRILKSLNNNTLFSSMAQNEMKTIVRIQKMRRKTIEDEKQKVIGALDAMCFLTQPKAHTVPSVKVISARSNRSKHSILTTPTVKK